jgi:hypothetical protein
MAIMGAAMARPSCGDDFTSMNRQCRDTQPMLHIRTACWR